MLFRDWKLVNVVNHSPGIVLATWSPTLATVAFVARDWRRFGLRPTWFDVMRTAMTRFSNAIKSLVGPLDTGKRIMRLMGLLAAVSAALIVWTGLADSRRGWSPAEVPIAFWSWRNEVPCSLDVEDAIRQTGARSLFQRAGQLDRESGKIRRIRAFTGPLPRGIEVHLVYNATRSFLSDFEHISATDACSIVIAAFEEDLGRARSDAASLVGVQLDFDVPTRLLPKYGELLKALRVRLQALRQGFLLSITGLPTWMDSAQLPGALSACDFWVPQFYGGGVSQSLDHRTPISSPEAVAKGVALARRLSRPFYAGLAAYGHAILYSRTGDLIELRGDLDPAAVVGHPDLQLIEQRPIESRDQSGTVITEWHCLYWAQRDVNVDGISIRAGETLLLDWPAAAGLRLAARRVREQGGDQLLGICVFRIPSSRDGATLRTSEIAAALKDQRPSYSLDARMESVASTGNAAALVTLTNSGSVASRIGAGALTVLLRVPPGALREVAARDTVLVEPVFEAEDIVERCSLRRANALKLTTNWWPPCARADIKLEFVEPGPREITLEVVATTDDGRSVSSTRTLRLAGD